MAWSSVAICSRMPLASPITSSSATPSEPPPPSSSHKPTSLPLPSFSHSFSNSNSAAIDHVIHPSLQFANLLWFKGTYNAQIFVGDSEPPESVVKRFRRAVMQAGVISECRRRRFFETPQDVLKRKRQASQRKRASARRPSGPRPDWAEKKEAPKVVVDDDDDNWEYDMK